MLFLLSIAGSMPSFAQTSRSSVGQRADSGDRVPFYFLDSVQVIASELAEVNPKNIVYMSELKNKDLHGGWSINSIFLETKAFVRNRYWLVFSQDAAYRKLVPSPEEDTQVVYIFNGKVLNVEPEKSLAWVNFRTFGGLTILDKAALELQYGVKGKKHGVIVQQKKDN